MPINTIDAVRNFNLQNNYKNAVCFKAGYKLSYTPSTDSFQDKCTQKGVNVPIFNAGKSIKYHEIVDFHKEIKERPDRDNLSYEFYTRPQEIGCGIPALGLPIGRTDDRTKSEMLNEIKRLLSDDSTLTFEEQRMLRYLYQNEPSIRFFRR